jgi:hypothetical protein
MIGDAGAHNPAPNNDDICCLTHKYVLLLTLISLTAKNTNCKKCNTAEYFLGHLRFHC